MNHQPPLNKAHQIRSKSHFPNKYEATYVYNDSIFRVYNTLSTIENIKLLINKTLLPFLFTTKPIPIEFTYTKGEFISLDYSKKVTWYLSSSEINIKITITFSLISNTIENTTLLILELIISNHEDNTAQMKTKIISGCKKICLEMIDNIETLLQNNTENIYHYDSNIIDASIEQVWNYVTRFEFFKSKKEIKINITGNPECVGSIITYQVEGVKGSNLVIQSKVAFVNKEDNKQKWKYKLIQIDNNVPIQELSYVFLKLEDNKTFIGIYNVFSEHVDNTMLNESAHKKKRFLMMMEEVFKKKSNISWK